MQGTTHENSAYCLSHADFVARIDQPHLLWGVRNLATSTLRVWGVRGHVFIVLSVSLVMAPMVATALFAVHRGSYGALGFVVVALVAAVGARPNINLISLSGWLLFAFGGGAVGAFTEASIYFVAGVLPALCWIIAGAARGTLLAGLEQRLRESEVAYKSLVEARQILLLGAPAPSSESPGAG